MPKRKMKELTVPRCDICRCANGELITGLANTKVCPECWGKIDRRSAREMRRAAKEFHAAMDLIEAKDTPMDA